jgi:hypothetical protein
MHFLTYLTLNIEGQWPLSLTAYADPKHLRPWTLIKWGGVPVNKALSFKFILLTEIN